MHLQDCNTTRVAFVNSQMVPIKEMTDVLKVIKETAYLKPKQWVRLKRGIFKDDLAQVRYSFYFDSKSLLYSNQNHLIV